MPTSSSGTSIPSASMRAPSACSSTASNAIASEKAAHGATSRQRHERRAMKRRHCLQALAALTLGTRTASAQTSTAIVGARLLRGTEPPLDDSVIVIDAGRIRYVGNDA